MINKKIGEKIRQARVIANLSQENISSELNISVGAYSNLERGKTEITVNRLVLIAKILNVHVFALLPETLTSKDIQDTPQTKLYSISNPHLAEITELRDQVNVLRKEVASIRKRSKK